MRCIVMHVMHVLLQSLLMDWISDRRRIPMPIQPPDMDMIVINLLFLGIAVVLLCG
nr:MAG TPA: hypothetical protein [Bacteriophage sp.]